MNSSTNKSRTLINIIGLPLILFVVYQGGVLFHLFVSFIMFLSIKEMDQLMKIKSYSINVIFLYSMIPIMFFSNKLYFNFMYPILNIKFATLDFLWPENFVFHLVKMDFIGIIIFLVVCIWEIFRFKNNPIENIAITLFALIWIVFFLDMFISIRNYYCNGFHFTLCILLSVWACDSAAFFFGSKFGKKKILPKISPNKTWIGTIAGYFFALLTVYSFSIIFLFLNFTILDVFILGTIFGVIGQLGDFFESLIKRELNVKDSGTILQGHGGVLDRFDSMFFVIPSFYVYILYKYPLF
tara:strand:+ start:226 stop:1116 length:891 start_codon:yes stop_codon:yes gene_type:complete